jgi:hypothetical protein
MATEAVRCRRRATASARSGLASESYLALQSETRFADPFSFSPRESTLTLTSTLTLDLDVYVDGDLDLDLGAPTDADTIFASIRDQRGKSTIRRTFMTSMNGVGRVKGRAPTFRSRSPST